MKYISLKKIHEDSFTENMVPRIIGQDPGYNVFYDGKPEKELFPLIV